MTVEEIKELYRGYKDGRIKFNANFYDNSRDVVEKTLTLMELVVAYDFLNKHKEAFNVTIVFDKYVTLKKVLPNCYFVNNSMNSSTFWAIKQKKAKLIKLVEYVKSHQEKTETEETVSKEKTESHKNSKSNKNHKNNENNENVK